MYLYIRNVRTGAVTRGASSLSSYVHIAVGVRSKSALVLVLRDLFSRRRHSLSHRLDRDNPVSKAHSHRVANYATYFPIGRHITALWVVFCLSSASRGSSRVRPFLAERILALRPHTTNSYFRTFPPKSARISAPGFVDLDLARAIARSRYIKDNQRDSEWMFIRTRIHACRAIFCTSVIQSSIFQIFLILIVIVRTCVSLYYFIVTKLNISIQYRF